MWNTKPRRSWTSSVRCLLNEDDDDDDVEGDRRQFENVAFL